MARERNLVEESQVELGRVITPFLDMAFQLLFFFVMMYQPSAMEGQMDMALPAAGEGVVKPDQKVTASSTDAIDLPAEVEVLIRTRDVERQDQVQQGDIGRIIVKETAREQTVEGIEALRRHLEAIRPKLNNKDAIKVQGDSKLKYGYVVLVMDVCRKAGFNDVAFSPPPDLQRHVPGQ